MPHFKYLERVAVGVALAVAAGLAACNEQDLLNVPTPDVVLPKDINGPSALPAAYAAAIGDFQVAYAGGYGNGLDNNEGIAQMSGLLADELADAETFNTRIEVDRRATKPINLTTLQTFQDLQRARATTDLVAERFRQFAPTDPRGPEIQALAGFSYVLLAEAYCNGVPTSRINDEGKFEYGAPQTGQQVLTSAVAKFDSAIAAAGAAGGGGSVALNLARIGKGRALLDLNQPAQAAAAVSAVPSSFNYSIQHSENTGRQNNAIYAFNYLEGRFAVGDREGTNGLPFASLNDPRMPIIDAGTGFDGETELFLTTKYPERKAPTPLALGVEARLIEAEAALRTGDLATFRAKLNDARANALTYTEDGSPNSQPLDSPPPLATVPSTATAQQNLLFQERAIDLFLTSHRLGDLRRLIWQYNRSPEAVFPTGPYEPTNTSKAGTNFGTDVNLPIPQEESNNPLFLNSGASCTNRSAGIS